MKRSLSLLAVACLLTAAVFGDTADCAIFSVRAFGATGDGRTLDTAAVNRAIAAAAAAGGGTVEFPAGDYLCHSIHLQSNVGLYLGHGATILAADPPPEGQAGPAYDPPEPNEWEFYQDFGHTHWHNSLIWGENLENISITGPGRIYGRGLSRGWHATRKSALPGEPPESAPADSAHDSTMKTGPFGYPNPHDSLASGVGNKAIALKNCRNVIFRDFTIFHGGHFAILATGVDNWTCDNLIIDTNRDGIDFDCCQNVRVSNCAINSPYDDGICPKSSYGLGRARMTENLTITNCQVSGFAEGTLIDGTRRLRPDGRLGVGRIKFGTESNGGFRNIVVSNCVFDHCFGMALESVDGALMEDIAISNITMRDIANAPVFIRLGARLRGPGQPQVGTARRIKIDNLVVHGGPAQAGILITGIPGHAIEDVTLSNILIDYAGGGTVEQATREVPELEKEYPEPQRFGTLPAWGLFARHVKNLQLRGVELRTLTADARPAVVLDDVHGARCHDVQLAATAGRPVWSFVNTSGVHTCDTTRLPEGDVPGTKERKPY
jgi:polygalacturonase